MARKAQELLQGILANDRAEVRRLLLEGADANLVLPEGATAFHVAVGVDNAEDMTALLLHHNANPNSQCADGLSPLHVAAMYNKCEVVEQLLSRNADVNIKDADGKTALEYAHSVGCLLCETRLKPLTSIALEDEEKSAAVQTTLLSSPKVSVSSKQCKQRKQSFYTSNVQNILDNFYNPVMHVMDVTSPDHPVICNRISGDATIWTPNSCHSQSHLACENSSPQPQTRGSFRACESEGSFSRMSPASCSVMSSTQDSLTSDPFSPPGDSPADAPLSPQDVLTKHSCAESSPDGSSLCLESPEENVKLGLMCTSPRRKYSHYFPDLISEQIDARPEGHSQESSGSDSGCSVSSLPPLHERTTTCVGSPSAASVPSSHITPRSSSCISHAAQCDSSSMEQAKLHASLHKNDSIRHVTPCKSPRKSPFCSPSNNSVSPQTRSPKKQLNSPGQQEQNFPVVGFSLDHSTSGEKRRRSQRLINKSINTSHSSANKSTRRLHNEEEPVICRDKETMAYSGDINSQSRSDILPGGAAVDSSPSESFCSAQSGGSCVETAPAADSSVGSFLPIDYDTDDLIVNISSSSGASMAPTMNPNDLTLNSDVSCHKERDFLHGLGQSNVDEKGDLSAELDKLSLLSIVSEDSINHVELNDGEMNQNGFAVPKPRSNTTKFPSHDTHSTKAAAHTQNGKGHGRDLRMNLQRKLQELKMEAGSLEVTLDDEDFEVNVPGSPRYAVKSKVGPVGPALGSLADNESIIAGYGLGGLERMYKPTATSSRNASACTVPTPDVSHITGLPTTLANPADVSTASSACSCQSVRTVRVESGDDGDSFTLLEEHFPVTRDWSPCPHTDSDGDESTLIYWGNVGFKTSPSDGSNGTPPGGSLPPDDRPATPSRDSERSDDESVTPVSVPDDIHGLSNSELRNQLEVLGDLPGPITQTTRHMYEIRLLRLRNDPTSVPTSSTGLLQYSTELQSALAGNLDMSALQDYEEEMSAPFAQVDASRHWREGTQKSSFNYLLLDPRVTKNLPNRTKIMGTQAAFDVFTKAIFYVGKGKRSRPYCHFKEAMHQLANPQQQVNRKVQHILDIWESGHGVVSLHVFQNVIPVEAYTREACMIEAIGLKHLTNQKSGDYYGNCATWFSKKKRLLGVRLLQKSFRIMLSEGERQLKPCDIRGG